MKLIDLTGNRFGRLVVIERVPAQSKDARWKCLCDCGNYTEASSHNLKRGKVTSCGCYRKEKSSLINSKDITGQIFGHLTAIRKVDNQGKRTIWECRCDCGNYREVLLDKLTSGVVTSCKSCVTISKEGIDKKRIFPYWFRDCLVDDADIDAFDNKSLRSRNEDSSYRKVRVSCRSCGEIYTQYVYKFMNSYSGSAYGICKKCSCFSHSHLEDAVFSYIKSITNTEIITNDKSLIINPVTGKPLEVDLYLPEYKLAIEVNGSYWHSENIKSCKKYHQTKFILCKNQGIHLVSLYDIDWLYNRSKVENILKSIIVSQKRIYARTLHVKKIEREEGTRFLREYHLDKDTVQSKYYYGLYQNDILVSVMSFGNLRGQNRHHSTSDCYELVRFASLPNIRIVGGASKLLHCFVLENSPKYILAYSDNDYFSGEVYKKIGFVFTKYTTPDYYWYSLSDKTYLPRWSCQPKILCKKYPEIAVKYSDSLEKNIMTELHYTRVYRTGQSVWEWFVDAEYKQMMKD